MTDNPQEYEDDDYLPEWYPYLLEYEDIGDLDHLQDWELPLENALEKEGYYEEDDDEDEEDIPLYWPEQETLELPQPEEWI